MAAIAVISAIGVQQAQAVEGGLETYLLGSRDSMAGILPPAGTYINNDIVRFSGTAPSVSMGGAVLEDPKLDVTIYKFNATHVFDATVAGARFGLNLNIPYVWSNIDLNGEISSLLSGGLSDQQYSFSDITVSPIFGWTHGNLHQTLALQLFLPTGAYDTATIDVQGRSVDVLSTGKNRFAFDPTWSVTWFEPAKGLELSGAFGITFSAENEATEYQTAPEAHFEGTVMQHFSNKMAVGVTGYAYRQLDDDSGQGAENMRGVVGAESLQAEVYGIGPIWTWSTTIGKAPVNVKAKYIVESGARRRFESDKAWLTVGFVF
ncbi:SphA family protein [Aliiruegeria sabulilitoris]|uniref:SphA family protein n=1 Tax=Aliiruegeria sabulilitoris TaxID=1510458 RepID=UPI00082F37EB|nr:transporter [Aliiruegeria sabulilitoris]NDR56167.1 hypothetical protein [Pseudoruegeria sp. M32A2M]